MVLLLFSLYHIYITTYFVYVFVPILSTYTLLSPVQRKRSSPGLSSYHLIVSYSSPASFKCARMHYTLARMHARTHACTLTRTRMHAHTHAHSHAHACTVTRTHAHSHAWTLTHASTLAHTHTLLHTHAYTAS
jgi:hypothetical protein